MCACYMYTEFITSTLQLVFYVLSYVIGVQLLFMSLNHAFVMTPNRGEMLHALLMHLAYNKQFLQGIWFVKEKELLDFHIRTYVSCQYSLYMCINYIYYIAYIIYNI